MAKFEIYWSETRDYSATVEADDEVSAWELVLDDAVVEKRVINDSYDQQSIREIGDEA